MKKYIIFLLFFISTTIFCEISSTGWIIFRKLNLLRQRSLLSLSPSKLFLSKSLVNSSLLSRLTTKEILFIADSGFSGDVLAGLFYAHPFKNKAISFGFLSYDVGEVTLYWIEDNQEQERTVKAQNDLLFNISYGFKIRTNLYMGLSTKFVKSKLIETIEATSYTLDFILSYYFKNGISILGFENLGFSSKFLETQEELPSWVFLGLGYKVLKPKSYSDYYANLAIDLNYIINETRILPSIGLEVGKSFVSLSLGYFNIDEGSLNLGISLYFKNFNINYFYKPAQWLNSSHSLFFNFNI